MNKMKYNLPTLLALYQDTSVHCNWTAQSKHCRSSGSGQDKKPVLSEKPRNRPSKYPTRSSRPVKNPSFNLTSKSKPQFRVTTTKRQTFNHPLSVNDAGFVLFLKTHTSPKHQRVTAGGRIVPMEPPNPPRLEYYSHDETNSTNAPGTTGILTPTQIQLIMSYQTGDGQDGWLEALAPRNPNLNASFLSLEMDPIEADFPRWYYPCWKVMGLHMTAQRFDTCQEIAKSLYDDEVRIAHLWPQIKHLDSSPFGEFYLRFAQCAFAWGPDALIAAYHMLKSKVSLHSRYLAEVNELIAMNGNETTHLLYCLRILNTRLRASALNAADFLEQLDFRQEWRLGQRAYLWYDGCSDEMPPAAIQPTGNNRGVDIIDPATGRPIVIQMSRTSADITNNNGHGGESAHLHQTEAELGSNLITYDVANDASGAVPGNAGIRSPSQNTQHPTGDVTPESDGSENISWVHQETWIAPLPSQIGTRLSETVPRNFGGSPHRYRVPVPSFSEFDQSRHAWEDENTTVVVEDPHPPLSPVVSVNEYNQNDNVEGEGLQIEQESGRNGINDQSGSNSQFPFFDAGQPLNSSEPVEIFQITDELIQTSPIFELSPDEDMGIRMSMAQRLTLPDDNTEGSEGSESSLARNQDRSDDPFYDSDQTIPLLSRANPRGSWNSSVRPARRTTGTQQSSSVLSGGGLSSTGSQMIATTPNDRHQPQSTETQRSSSGLSHETPQSSSERMVYARRHRQSTEAQRNSNVHSGEMTGSTAYQLISDALIARRQRLSTEPQQSSSLLSDDLNAQRQLQSPGTQRSSSGLSEEMLSSTSSQMTTTTSNARHHLEGARGRAEPVMNNADPSRLISDLRDDIPVTAAIGFTEPDCPVTPDREDSSRTSAQLMNPGERQTAPAVVNVSRIHAYAQRR